MYGQEVNKDRYILVYVFGKLGWMQKYSLPAVGLKRINGLNL